MHEGNYLPATTNNTPLPRLKMNFEARIGIT
jgi:hypothetical protein